MQTGFVTINGNLCYFGSDGIMIRDSFFTVGSKTYYARQTGVIQTGKKTIDGSVYYFDPDTAVMQTGWVTIQGSKYYFGTDGAMKTGWFTVNSNKYYASSGGVIQTKWQTIDGYKYYFKNSGVMLTGWVVITGNTYYFGSNGRMQTGLVTLDGTVYNFGTNGILKTLRICLDAGHYGKYNQSPVNSAYYESDMTWKLHLYLKEELEKYGITVITTRTTQANDLSLAERGQTAAGCDLFLSVHSNACSSSSIDAPLACCCISGVVNDLGLQLANTVANVMGTSQSGMIWNRVGDNGDYYGVLRNAALVGVPGILLEHSYHTNLRATNWLLVDSNLQKMAVAEAATIAAYYGMDQY